MSLASIRSRNSFSSGSKQRPEAYQADSESTSSIHRINVQSAGSHGGASYYATAEPVVPLNALAGTQIRPAGGIMVGRIVVSFDEHV